MKIRHACLVLATALAVTAGPIAKAASADIMELEPELRAKVAREKLKQHSTAGNNDPKNMASGSSSRNSNCGQVDIGNSAPEKGSKAVNPREKTVIVTGPVINATKCR